MLYLALLLVFSFDISNSFDKDLPIKKTPRPETPTFTSPQNALENSTHSYYDYYDEVKNSSDFDWTPPEDDQYDDDNEYEDWIFEEYSEKPMEKFDKEEAIAVACRRDLCVANWISREKQHTNFSLLSLKCLGYYHVPTDMKLISQGLVPYQVLATSYDWRVRDCNRTEFCSLSGFFGYYRMGFYHFRYKLLYYHLFLCYPEVQGRCRATNLFTLIKAYIPLFTFPATILLNILNLGIMRKLLKESPGAALFFHLAEIVTDLISNLLYSLQATDIFYILGHWWAGCPISSILEVDHFITIFKEAFQFLNQCFLTGLIADRVVAIRFPMKYYKYNHKKRSVKATVCMVISTLILYIPYTVTYGFYPIFLSKFGASSSLIKNYRILVQDLPLILRSGINVFVFALLVVQIIGFLVIQKGWKNFTKNAPVEEKEERIKQEKEKKKLLIGTIGINLVTNFFIFGVKIIEAIFKIEYINLSLGDHYYTVKMLKAFTEILVAVLLFANGSLGIVFHVIFTKTYRKAFYETRIGKLVSKFKTESLEQ